MVGNRRRTVWKKRSQEVRMWSEANRGVLQLEMPQQIRKKNNKKKEELNKMWILCLKHHFQSNDGICKKTIQHLDLICKVEPKLDITCTLYIQPKDWFYFVAVFYDFFQWYVCYRLSDGTHMQHLYCFRSSGVCVCVCVCVCVQIWCFPTVIPTYKGQGQGQVREGRRDRWPSHSFPPLWWSMHVFFIVFVFVLFYVFVLADVMPRW